MTSRTTVSSLSDEQQEEKLHRRKSKSPRPSLTTLLSSPGTSPRPFLAEEQPKRVKIRRKSRSGGLKGAKVTVTSRQEGGLKNADGQLSLAVAPGDTVILEKVSKNAMHFHAKHAKTGDVGWIMAHHVHIVDDDEEMRLRRSKSDGKKHVHKKSITTTASARKADCNALPRLFVSDVLEDGIEPVVGGTIRALRDNDGGHENVDGTAALVYRQGDLMTLKKVPDNSLQWIAQHNGTQAVGWVSCTNVEIVPPEKPRASCGVELRDRCAFELLDSEKSYVEALVLLCDAYEEPLRTRVGSLEEVLTAQEIATVFGNCQLLRSTHVTFLTTLEERMAQWGPDTMVGDVLEKMLPFFKVVEDYINAYDVAVAKAAELLSKRSQFAHFCELLRYGAEQRGRSLQALLVMPVQRVPRYRLLIDSLAKATPDKHPDKALLARASALCDTILTRTNESKRDAEGRARMLALSKDMDRGGDTLVAPHRRLLLEMPAIVMDEYGHRQKCVVMLFNDILLIGKRRKVLIRKKLQVRKRIALSRAKVPVVMSIKEAQDVGEFSVRYGIHLRRQVRLAHKRPQDLVTLHDAIVRAIRERSAHIDERYHGVPPDDETEFDASDESDVAVEVLRQKRAQVAGVLSTAWSTARGVTESDDEDSVVPVLQTTTSQRSVTDVLPDDASDDTDVDWDTSAIDQVVVPRGVAVVFVLTQTGKPSEAVTKAANKHSKWRVVEKLEALHVPLDVSTRLLLLNGFPQSLEEARLFEMVVCRPVRVIALANGAADQDHQDFGALVNTFDGMMAEDGGPLLCKLLGEKVEAIERAVLGDARDTTLLLAALDGEAPPDAAIVASRVGSASTLRPSNDDLTVPEETSKTETTTSGTRAEMTSSSSVLPDYSDLSELVDADDTEEPPSYDSFRSSLPISLPAPAPIVEAKVVPPPPPYEDAQAAPMLPPPQVRQKYDWSALQSQSAFVSYMDSTDVYILLRDTAPRTALLRVADAGDRVEIVAMMLLDESDPKSGRTLVHLPIMSTHEGGGVLAVDATPKFFVPSLPTHMCASVWDLLAALKFVPFVPRQFHQFGLCEGHAGPVSCVWCNQWLLDTNMLQCRQCERCVHIGCCPLAAHSLCVGNIEAPELRKKRSIRRVFDQLDAHHRGFLTADVLCKVFAMSPTDTEAFMAQWDINHDGRIDFAEFHALLESRFWDVFMALDTNKDGVLSTDELAAGIEQLGGRLPENLAFAHGIHFEEFFMTFFVSLSR